MMDQFVPRAYPFTNLWGLEATAQNVCETLPDDSDLVRYVLMRDVQAVLRTGC